MSIESFTETKAKISPKTIQLAPMAFQPSRIAANPSGHIEAGARPEFSPENAVMAMMTTDKSAMPQAHKPGSARFHGNGIGGAVASRQTTSITEATNPDDGTISAS